MIADKTAAKLVYIPIHTIISFKQTLLTPGGMMTTTRVVFQLQIPDWDYDPLAAIARMAAKECGVYMAHIKYITELFITVTFIVVGEDYNIDVFRKSVQEAAAPVT